MDKCFDRPDQIGLNMAVTTVLGESAVGNGLDRVCFHGHSGGEPVMMAGTARKAGYFGMQIYGDCRTWN